MPRYLLAVLCLYGVLFCPPLALAAQPAGAGSPVGLWLSADHQGVIAITACGSGLCGHLAGVTLDHPTDPLPVDWRGRPQCGDPMIAVSPVLDKPDKWRGTVTDPRNGDVWPATLTYVHGALRLHGYFAVPLFGETQTWTRYQGHIGPHCLFQAPAA